jgi:uncharacterized protein YqgC (DUF456 family)
VVIRLRDALLLLLVVAVGLRLAAGLVSPALPLLVILWFLVVVYSVLFSRRR